MKCDPHLMQQLKYAVCKRVATHSDIVALTIQKVKVADKYAPLCNEAKLLLDCSVERVTLPRPL